MAIPRAIGDVSASLSQLQIAESAALETLQGCTFNIEYDASTVSKVRFTSSSLQSVSVRGCNWTNVSFTECRLSNVTFTRVKLTNVHFYNVDFTRVRMQDLQIGNCRWMDKTPSFACITIDSFSPAQRSLTGLHLPLPVLSSSTSIGRTTGVRNYRVPERDEFRKLISQEQLTEVGIFYKWTPRLLFLPKEVLKIIMDQLYPKENVKIIDFLPVRGKRFPSGQTIYNKVTGGVSLRCTYIGWKDGHNARNFVGSRKQAPNLGLCPEFLRVSRKCYEMSIKHLYARKFIFTTSAESCLAFLHDHQEFRHTIRAIRIHYGPRTKGETWRRLFNKLVRERTLINSLEVIVSSAFWQEALWYREKKAHVNGKGRWTGCVTAILDWKGWSNEDEVDKKSDKHVNFLRHFARLHLEKVSARIHICDVDKDRERKLFYVALITVIRTLRARRPDLLLARTWACHCKKELENCCYWE